MSIRVYPLCHLDSLLHTNSRDRSSGNQGSQWASLPEGKQRRWGRLTGWIGWTTVPATTVGLRTVTGTWFYTLCVTASWLLPGDHVSCPVKTWFILVQVSLVRSLKCPGCSCALYNSMWFLLYPLEEVFPFGNHSLEANKALRFMDGKHRFSQWVLWVIISKWCVSWIGLL